MRKCHQFLTLFDTRNQLQALNPFSPKRTCTCIIYQRFSQSLYDVYIWFDSKVSRACKLKNLQESNAIASSCQISATFPSCALYFKGRVPKLADMRTCEDDMRAVFSKQSTLDSRLVNQSRGGNLCPLAFSRPCCRVGNTVSDINLSTPNISLPAELSILLSCFLPFSYVYLPVYYTNVFLVLTLNVVGILLESNKGQSVTQKTNYRQYENKQKWKAVYIENMRYCEVVAAKKKKMKTE